MTAPAPALADEFTVRRVRFVGGRTWHRIRPPTDQRWWDQLEAACGKTGYLARGYPGRPIRDCRGCAKAVGDEDGTTVLPRV